MPYPMLRTKEAMGRFSLGLTLCGVLCSLLLTAGRRVRQVPEASLDAAAAFVRANYAPGDVILVNPPTQVGPRLRLGDLPLWEPRDLRPAALRDLVMAHGRVHLMQLDALGSDTAVHEVMATLGEAIGSGDWPGVHVRRFELKPPGQLILDVFRDLEQASVSLRRGEHLQSCAHFQNQRWLCPQSPSWNYVGRTLMEFEKDSRTCVWLHPARAGTRLFLSLPFTKNSEGGQEPGSEATSWRVEGGFGFTHYGARYGRAPVALRLLANGRELTRWTHARGQGWIPFERVFGEELRHATALELEVQSRDNGAAHFCGNLRVWALFEVPERTL